MIFEGASEHACSQQVEANDRPASTLISCLVQPRGCNPIRKKAAQTKRQRSTGSDGNDDNEEKIFSGDGPSIDFRGHLAVRLGQPRDEPPRSF